MEKKVHNRHKVKGKSNSSQSGQSSLKAKKVKRRLNDDEYDTEM